MPASRQSHPAPFRGSPAFLTNLLQLLIGPLYLVDKICNRLFGKEK